LPRSTAIASVVARKPLVTELIWKTVRVLTGSPAFLHAKPLGVDELVAGDDADSEAGAVESGHALGNVAFKLIRTLREKITSDESR
jgi:hypothetical protein